jgi:hypothetical protein
MRDAQRGAALAVEVVMLREQIADARRGTATRGASAGCGHMPLRT